MLRSYMKVLLAVLALVICTAVCKRQLRATPSTFTLTCDTVAGAGAAQA